MKRFPILSSLALLLTATHLQAGGAQILSYSTPSYIDFGQSNYRIAQGETNLLVTILRTGDYREAASVDLSTRDATAKAGTDYSPISTRVYFPPQAGFATVSISIQPSAGSTSDQTFYLDLKNPSANGIIESPSAQVTISSAQVAQASSIKLNIRPGPNGTVLISWSASAGSNVLEKCQSPSGSSWSAVTGTPNTSGSVTTMSDTLVGGTCFYRLRKN